MKILAIIPARGGSKGIPLKNLVKLNGKPLLYYSINSSLHSKYIDKTIISTDNKKIKNYAKKFNVEIIDRPKKLASNTAKIEPVISHTLDYLKKISNYVPDVIVLLQNTSPLRTSNHVESALKFFFKNNFDSVLSSYVSHKFFWKNNNNKYFPVNYEPQNRPNRQNMDKQFIENGAIYITKYDSFRKSKCRVSGKLGLFIMNEEDSIDIDTSFDLLCAKSLLKSRNKK